MSRRIRLDRVVGFIFRRSIPLSIHGDQRSSLRLETWLLNPEAFYKRNSDFEVIQDETEIRNFDSLVSESTNVGSRHPSEVRRYINTDIIIADSSHCFSTWWQSSLRFSRLSML